MILVLAANGNIGFPVVKKLLSSNAEVRALVHSQASAHKLKELGVADVQVGDIANKNDLQRAIAGCSTVFHVIPPFNENEFEIGKNAIQIAKDSGVEHFIYNSVLHSQLHDMPHHVKKMLVEEELILSGLNYNIIRPAMLMQNILSSWKRIVSDGIFAAISNPTKKHAFVDAEDVGEAIANIILIPKFRNSICELVGSDSLTYEELSSLVGDLMQKPLQLRKISTEERIFITKSQNWSEYATTAFSKMLDHYDNHGFPGGNPVMLSLILGRKPNTYSRFIKGLISNL